MVGWKGVGVLPFFAPASLVLWLQVSVCELLHQPLPSCCCCFLGWQMVLKLFFCSFVAHSQD